MYLSLPTLATLISACISPILSNPPHAPPILRLPSSSPLLPPTNLTHHTPNAPSNWPPTPYTLHTRPLTIHLLTYGRRITSPALKTLITTDLSAITEHYYTSFAELRYHSPLSYTQRHVTATLTPSGLSDISAYEFAQALNLVLDMVSLWGWDAIEILEAQIVVEDKPGVAAAGFEIRFDGVGVMGV